MNTKIMQSVKIILLALVLALGVQYVIAQSAGTWSTAPANPPANNTAAPINVGSILQVRDGPLTVNKPVGVGGLSIIGDFNFLPSLGATVKSGQILMADGATGKVKWTDVAATQSVSCNNIAGTSFVSLNGNNSGNNGGIVVNAGTLNPGTTYKFSGSGNTYNVGGGGWAGIILDSRSDLTYFQANAALSGIQAIGGEPVTNGTGNSYKFYTSNDASLISGGGGSSPLTVVIGINKRNGLNDGHFNINQFTFDNTNGATIYVYIVVGQAAIDGVVNIGSNQNICSGGVGAVAAGSVGGGAYNYQDPAGTGVLFQTWGNASVNSNNITCPTDYRVQRITSSSANSGSGWLCLKR